MISDSQQIKLGRDCFDLGEWGRAFPSPAGELSYMRIEGNRGSVELRMYGGSGFASGHEIWLDSPGGVAIVIGHCALPVYRVDLVEVTRTRVAVLDREEDCGLGWLRFIPIAGVGALVAYENGLLRIDEDGRWRWHVIHGDLRNWVDVIDRDTIWLQSQAEYEREEDRPRYGFRLDDGSPVPAASRLSGDATS